MKWKILIPALLIISTFSACKKDDPPAPTPIDPRDKFVGTYVGTQNFSIPSLQINETDPITFDIVKSTTNSSRILVDGLVATVNGNSFTYVEFTETEYDPDTQTNIVYTFNGTGTLNGSNLIQSGTVRTVAVGSIFNGTWSSNTVKQ
jgi:hypothetical protein